MKKYLIKNINTSEEFTKTEKELKIWFSEVGIEHTANFYRTRGENTGYNHHKGFKLLKITEEKEIDAEIDEKSGKVQYKPKLIENGDSVIVYYGDGLKIETTKDEVRKAMKLFCGGKGSMTMQDTALEMKWTDEEFYAVKTAYGMKKNSVPYINEDIDNNDVEDLAELTRIEKKRQYKQSLHNKKYKDMETELKKLHQKEYLVEKIIEGMKDIKIEIPERIEKPKKTVYLGNEGIVHLTDWHFGAKTNNPYNIFNRNVAEKRVDKFIEESINEIEMFDIEKLHIIITGDMIEGIIHNSSRMQSDLKIIESIIFVTEQLTKLISKLYLYTDVEVDMIHGNHGRVQQGKEDNTDEENFEDLIPIFLKRYLQNEDIKINENVRGNVIRKITKHANILALHGDKSTPEKLIDNSFDKSGFNADLCLVGHWHSFKKRTYKKCEIIQTGSLAGVLEYAAGKELISDAGQTMIILFDKSKYMSFEVNLQ